MRARAASSRTYPNGAGAPRDVRRLEWNDSGAGSLRQAILDANAVIGNDVIAFNIPSDGLHTIVLSSALPAITRRVTIDGYTQLGSSPNDNPTGQGLNTVLAIEIEGPGTGRDPCLTVRADGTIIQGLVINRCGGAGILVADGGDGTLIFGNFIGTDPTGSSHSGGSSRASTFRARRAPSSES